VWRTPYRKAPSRRSVDDKLSYNTHSTKTSRRLLVADLSPLPRGSKNTYFDYRAQVQFEKSLYLHFDTFANARLQHVFASIPSVKNQSRQHDTTPTPTCVPCPNQNETITSLNYSQHTTEKKHKQINILFIDSE
jgi:hypothetical protein